VARPHRPLFCTSAFSRALQSDGPAVKAWPLPIAGRTKNATPPAGMEKVVLARRLPGLRLPLWLYTTYADRHYANPGVATTRKLSPP
jgi:hypothetical protein